MEKQEEKEDDQEQENEKELEPLHSFEDGDLTNIHKQLVIKYSLNNEEDEESTLYKQLIKNPEYSMLNTLLKAKYPDLEISSKALNRMHDFVSDIMTLLVQEAGSCTVEGDSKKVTSEEVRKSILALLGAHLDEVPRPVIISRYFKIVDQASAYIEKLAKDGEEDGWRYLREREGIKIYKKDTAKYYIHCIKGVGEVSHSVEKIRLVCLDVDNMREWDPLFQDGKVLESIDSHTEVAYMVFGAQVCIIKQSREFVGIYHWHYNPDGSCTISCCSVEHPASPPTSAKTIRGEIIGAGYVIAPKAGNPEKSVVTYLCHINLRDHQVLGTFITGKFSEVIQERQPLNIARIQRWLDRKQKKDA